MAINARVEFFFICLWLRVSLLQAGAKVPHAAFYADILLPRLINFQSAFEAT